MAKEPIIESEGAALDVGLGRTAKRARGKGNQRLGNRLCELEPRAWTACGRGFTYSSDHPQAAKPPSPNSSLDQTAMHSRVTGMYFSFAETKKELRIKTLARLSGLDQREIRRGSAYLLHWYGVPRLAGSEQRPAAELGKTETLGRRRQELARLELPDRVSTRHDRAGDRSANYPKSCAQRLRANDDSLSTIASGSVAPINRWTCACRLSPSSYKNRREPQHACVGRVAESLTPEAWLAKRGARKSRAGRNLGAGTRP